MNGPAIRAFNTQLATEVSRTLEIGAFPLVLGGDCSILLGCLRGAREAGPVGLVHLDGHSDYGNPANFKATPWERATGGLALALVTGKGEPLLAEWGEEFTPLVEEANVVQLGERERDDVDYAFPDIASSQIHQTDISVLLSRGPATCAAQALEAIEVERVWVHLDIDILDAAVMPAVDCPGSPGLDWSQLEELLTQLLGSGRVIGLDVTIFDPDIDVDGRHARQLCDLLISTLKPDSR